MSISNSHSLFKPLNIDCSLMHDCLNLLPFNHNCHKKKKKDDFFIFFGENLLNVTDRSLLNLKAEKSLKYI